MYSVVLMAALTAGGEAPACHWGHGGCHGCYGCSGCSGCWGCCGGCYGGCYGGCHGCSGCWGCCGGCWGGYSSCYGCYGCYGCHGCWGCGGCYGGYSGAPVVIEPGSGHMESAPAEGEAPAEKVKPPKKEPKKDAQGAAPSPRARVIVSLPADAKLYVNDQLMRSTSARRVFRTPELDSAQTYYYVMRAEILRDGKTVSQTRRVTVRPGAVIEASFGELGRDADPAVASTDR